MSTAAFPPGPRSPAAWQLARWLHDPRAFLSQCRKDHGDIFTVRWPAFGPSVHFCKPEHLRALFALPAETASAGESKRFLEPILGAHSLLVLDGTPHQRERRLLMPSLTGEALQAHSPEMLSLTNAMIDAWPSHQPVQLLEAFRTLTLDIILRVVFGLETQTNSLSKGLAELTGDSNSVTLFFPPLQRDLGTWSPWGKFLTKRARIDEELYRELALRRAATTPHHDVLSLLLRVRDENDSPMSDREIRDQLLTLLLTGHETTTVSLAWTVERLLAHPSVEKRAREEVQSVTKGSAVEEKHLSSLPYIDAIVREALRVRPVFYLVGRRLHQETELAGHTLPANIEVVANLWLAHHREETWPEPFRFRPERFLESKTDPFAWVPFGGGARRCIGAAMALHEIKAVLAVLLQRTTMERVHPDDEPAQQRGIVMAPARGVPVQIRRH